MPADSATRVHGADGARERVDSFRRATAALRTSAARRFDGGTFAAASAWLAAQGDLPSLLDVEFAFDGVRDTTPLDIQLGSGTDEHTLCTSIQRRISSC